MLLKHHASNREFCKIVGRRRPLKTFACIAQNIAAVSRICRRGTTLWMADRGNCSWCDRAHVGASAKFPGNAIDTPQTLNAAQVRVHHFSTATLPVAAGIDQYHRVKVCAMVFDLLAAARCDQLTEYLKPIPVTRLHAAKNAFHEIGAHSIASSLHAAQFSLTRVGPRVPVTQAVVTLSAALAARTEDIDGLIANYLRLGDRAR